MNVASGGGEGDGFFEFDLVQLVPLSLLETKAPKVRLIFQFEDEYAFTSAIPSNEADSRLVLELINDEVESRLQCQRIHLRVPKPPPFPSSARAKSAQSAASKNSSGNEEFTNPLYSQRSGRNGTVTMKLPKSTDGTDKLTSPPATRLLSDYSFDEITTTAYEAYLATLFIKHRLPTIATIASRRSDILDHYPSHGKYELSYNSYFICNICTQLGYGILYSCYDCEYYVHPHCFLSDFHISFECEYIERFYSAEELYNSIVDVEKLPNILASSFFYHFHDLKKVVLKGISDNSGSGSSSALQSDVVAQEQQEEFICSICEFGGKRVLYHCQECSYDVHPQCILKNHPDYDSFFQSFYGKDS